MALIVVATIACEGRNPGVVIRAQGPESNLFRTVGTNLDAKVIPWIPAPGLDPGQALPLRGREHA